MVFVQGVPQRGVENELCTKVQAASLAGRRDDGAPVGLAVGQGERVHGGEVGRHDTWGKKDTGSDRD